MAVLTALLATASVAWACTIEVSQTEVGLPPNQLPSATVTHGGTVSNVSAAINGFPNSTDSWDLVT
ncbi:MAG: hypothetical protein M3065_00210, partial [Actinomycetota bacterium]|nr:hypothetical protein [Actinomycetota bacterium]